MIRNMSTMCAEDGSACPALYRRLVLFEESPKAHNYCFSTTTKILRNWENRIFKFLLHPKPLEGKYFLEFNSAARCLTVWIVTNETLVVRVCFLWGLCWIVYSGGKAREKENEHVHNLHRCVHTLTIQLDVSYVPMAHVDEDLTTCCKNSNSYRDLAFHHSCTSGKCRVQFCQKKNTLHLRFFSMEYQRLYCWFCFTESSAREFNR